MKDYIRINKVIGRRERDEIVVCDSVFERKDGLKGAVGTSFRPVGEDEYARMHDAGSQEVQDCLSDLWIAAVNDGRTTEGLQDYCQEIIDIDGNSVLWDLSYCDMYNLIREAYPEYADKEAYPLFECIGRGRCFRADMKWDDLHDPETWKMIKQYETK